jgi:hypothetical protein
MIRYGRAVGALALLLLLTVYLGRVPGNSALAQDEITSATPMIIDGLREDAARDRVFADQQLDRARQWRELEANARKYAAQTSDPEWQKSWLEDAARHARSATELEDYAKQLKDKANAEEARANRLEAAVKSKNQPTALPAAPPAGPPATTAAAPDSTQPGLRVEDVLGFWQSREGPPMAIAVLSEAGAGSPATSQLVARTKKRIWKGTFIAAASGPVVRLSYTPKSAEMNPEIPDWARQAAEGKLVWRIELTPKGENYDLMLSGKWFAGEVRWDPDTNDPLTVEISDEKNPYEFELDLNYGISVEALELPVLSLQVRTAQEYDPDVYPVDALTMGQAFSPRLTFPAEMAKSVGAKISVDISGVNGGGSESVELKRRGRIGTGPATYLPDQPVIVSDDCSASGLARRNVPTGSVSWLRRWLAGDVTESDSTLRHWIAGDDPGPCLQLAVKSGDQIELKYADTAIRLPLYASWVQHGLARHKALLARLRVALEAIAAGRAGTASVEPAKKRLRMLDNYERVIASDKITDVHRFNIGELYLGDNSDSPAIVRKSDLEFNVYADGLIKGAPRQPDNPTLLNPLMKAFLEGLTGNDLSRHSGQAADKVQWTSPWEELLVRDAIGATSDNIEANAIQTWVENFSFGGYEGYVMATGGAQLWLAATGLDHHGVKQTGWEQLFAAVGVASNVVLTFAGGAPEEAFSSPSKAATLGKGLQTDSTLLAQVGRSVEEAAKGATFAGLPETLSAAERDQLLLTATADLGKAEKPVSCAFRAGKPAISTLMEVRSVPGNAPDAAAAAEQSRIMGYIRRYWGGNAKIVGGWTEQPILPLQEGPTCNGMAANYLAYKLRGLRRLESEMRRAVLKIMRDQVEEFDMQPGGVSFGKRARQGLRTADDFKLAPGFLWGFDNLAVRDYLRSMGLSVTEIVPAENAKVKLRHIWNALRRNYGVKVVVDFARAGAIEPDLHSVVVEEVIGTVSNGRTNITAVRIYDSNVGRIMEIPARDFDRLLARNWKYGGVITLVRPDRVP